ncbi:MAG: hypothetical protein R3217_10445 [Gammaproteobacteria bacterium]|nr:hypothetical protein [Gammaproteobacteria bacterium]
MAGKKQDSNIADLAARLASDEPEASTSDQDIEIPELDDVVKPVKAEPKPPPNFDLFADAGIDREQLKAEIRQALETEIDAVMADLKQALATALQASLEARVQKELPALLDRIFDQIVARRHK